MPSILVHFAHIVLPGIEHGCDKCRQSAVEFIRTDEKQLLEEDLARLATVHFAAGHGFDVESLHPAQLEEVEIMWGGSSRPTDWTAKTLRMDAERHRRQFDHFFWRSLASLYCAYKTPTPKLRVPQAIPPPASAPSVGLAQTGHPALRSAGPSSSALSGQPSESTPQTGKRSSDLFSPGFFSKRETNQQPQNTNMVNRAQDNHDTKKADEPKHSQPAIQNMSTALFNQQRTSQPWPKSQSPFSAPEKPQQTIGFAPQPPTPQVPEFLMPCRRRSLQHAAGEQTLAAAFRAGQAPQQHPLAGQHKAQQGPGASTAEGSPGKAARPGLGDRNAKKLPRSGTRKSLPVNNAFAPGGGGAPFVVSPAGSPQKVVQQHAESRHPLVAELLYAGSDEPMRDASGCYDMFDDRSGHGL